MKILLSILALTTIASCADMPSGYIGIETQPTGYQPEPEYYNSGYHEYHNQEYHTGYSRFQHQQYRQNSIVIHN